MQDIKTNAHFLDFEDLVFNEAIKKISTQK